MEEKGDRVSHWGFTRFPGCGKDPVLEKKELDNMKELFEQNGVSYCCVYSEYTKLAKVHWHGLVVLNHNQRRSYLGKKFPGYHWVLVYDLPGWIAYISKRKECIMKWGKEPKVITEASEGEEGERKRSAAKKGSDQLSRACEVALKTKSVEAGMSELTLMFQMRNTMCRQFIATYLKKHGVGPPKLFAANEDWPERTRQKLLDVLRSSCFDSYKPLWISGPPRCGKTTFFEAFLEEPLKISNVRDFVNCEDVSSVKSLLLNDFDWSTVTTSELKVFFEDLRISRTFSNVMYGKSGFFEGGSLTSIVILDNETARETFGKKSDGRRQHVKAVIARLNCFYIKVKKVCSIHDQIKLFCPDCKWKLKPEK